MEAELLPDGRARLTVSFSELSSANLAIWTTMGALHEDEGRWHAPAGITYQQAWALTDEITAVLYFVEGRPQTVDPRTGELRPPGEPRRTGTAWDDLPRVEIEELLDATKLSDKRVVLVLPSEKVVALADALDVALARVAPNRSESEKEIFRLRVAPSTEKAEVLRDQLRHLDRETRVKGSK
jgi:hypothetical protein